MIQIFEKKYKAISNIFVTTYDDNKYVFPSPIHLKLELESEKDNKQNRLEMTFNSYYESVLFVDAYFTLFFYLLSYEFKIDTLIIPTVSKLENKNSIDGYCAEYTFNSDEISMNLGADEIHTQYSNLFKEVSYL